MTMEDRRTGGQNLSAVPYLALGASLTHKDLAEADDAQVRVRQGDDFTPLPAKARNSRARAVKCRMKFTVHGVTFTCGEVPGHYPHTPHQEQGRVKYPGDIVKSYAVQWTDEPKRVWREEH